MSAKFKLKRFNVYNEQMMNAWKKYNSQSNLIGESFLVKKRKWFKTTIEEKILTDSWIECSYNVIDKNNVVTKVSNKRIREFEDFDNLLKSLQRTVMTKPALDAIEVLNVSFLIDGGVVAWHSIDVIVEQSLNTPLSHVCKFFPNFTDCKPVQPEKAL